ncbi:MAG: hypothetical protein JEZ05_10250 [Tenericutes bacterium]|nr:hypothetical protein [Mycoplasmatota bacterium]
MFPILILAIVFENIFFEILLLLLVLVIILAVTSILIIRNMQLEFKKVYKIRSKFHIEIRKIVNLMYKIHQSELLEPFTTVVIKNLPHTEKSILLRNIDAEYQEIDIKDPDNKYIVETYENLQNLRRERDAKILNYNQKNRTFPFNIYARIMKLPRFEIYTEKY